MKEVVLSDERNQFNYDITLSISELLNLTTLSLYATEISKIGKLQTSGQQM